MTVSEQELKDAAVGPRITKEDVEDNIGSVHFFTAWDGVQQADIGVDFNPPYIDVTPLKLLTFCVIILKNGYTVHGISACADPNNYNKDIGQRLAYEDAKNKIWALMGYELRTRLALNEKVAR